MRGSAREADTATDPITTTKTKGAIAAAMIGRSMTRTTTTTTTRDKPWLVLSCDGGYIANEFEIYNGAARRPRIAVVQSLQDASIFSEKDSRVWQKLGVEVLGIDSRPIPVRFVKRKDNEGKDWTEVMIHEPAGRSQVSHR